MKRLGRAGHPPSYRAHIVHLLKGGVKYRDLAKQHGLSTATLAKWAREANLEARDTGPALGSTWTTAQRAAREKACESPDVELCEECVGYVV